jgi:YHS domain-containing protein
MRKWFIFGVSILFALAMFGETAWSGQKRPEGKAQTVCPVFGGKIDKKDFTDYQGKRIYFCCAGCKEEFYKDPEKYLKKMASEGVVLEGSPEKSP